MLKRTEYTTLVSVTIMPLQETPTITWTAELEMARALFAVGDDDDVLRIVLPICERDDGHPIDRLGALQLKACVEWRRHEYTQSLETLKRAGTLVDDAPLDLRGKFFGQRALVYRSLNQIDGALVDYEAARECANDCGDATTEATIRNNVAVVYSDAGRTDEALLEIDAAIKTFTRLHDDVNLGYCYDTRAQVLIGVHRYVEALTCTKRAISLLANHPAGVGARSTHGLAMIGVGVSCLEAPKTIEQFRQRRAAARSIHVELDRELLKVALKRANGHVLGAAKLLHVSHSAIIGLIKKHGLERVPQRRRAKSLVTKINP